MATTVVGVLVLLCAAVAGAATNPYCEAPLPRFVPVGDGLVLRQVVVVSRHGDRSPMRALPHEHAEPGVVWDCSAAFPEGANVTDDPNITTTLAVARYAVPDDATAAAGSAGWRGNCPPGYLTATGARQTHALGRALRAVYVTETGLLPAVLDPTLLRLRATEVPRARHSLLAVLAGLYPDTAHAAVPYEVRAAAHETLLPNTAACPRVARLPALAQQQPAWRAHAARIAPLLTRLRRITGAATAPVLGARAGASGSSVTAWFDALAARTCHGLPLPCGANSTECVTEADVAVLAEGAALYANSMYDVNASGAGAAAARLAAGPLVREVQALLEEAARGTRDAPRYVHLSGHDTTLVALMAALQCRLPAFPPYAATVRFELFAGAAADGARHYVRVLYNNDVLAVPECGAALCPLDVFRAMVDARLTPRAGECAVPDDDDDDDASAPWPVAAVAAVAVLGALLALVSVALVVVTVVVVTARRRGTAGDASKPLLAPVNGDT